MGKLWNWFKYSQSPQSKTRTKAKPNTPEVVEAVEVADESDYGTTSEESDYGTASAESDYGTTSAEYEAGKFDGYKGRANRFANRQFLEETAWKAASKAERKQQLRGGYTVSEHGLKVDPYGNPKMIRLQLAAPGTPKEYIRGYWAGTADRNAEY